MRLSVSEGNRWADVQFRKSKTDQQAFGYAVESRKSGEPGAREALEWLREWVPERFEGSYVHQPLFRWRDGQLVTRDALQEALQRAAEGVGLPREHSLRIGGASAMLYATWHRRAGRP